METFETFPLPEDMQVIDSHTHIHSSFQFTESGASISCAQLLEAYRQNGEFSHIAVLAIPYLRDRDVCQNLMVALMKLNNPNVFGYGGLVYPDQPVTLPFRGGLSPEEQLDDLLAVGFDGIKMLESKPNARKLLGLALDDMAYDPFFSKLEQQQTHLIWHVNDPDNFWDPETFRGTGLNPAWCYAGEGFLSYEEIYSEVFHVLERHPNLNVTFAHLFFMSEQPDRLEALFEKYPRLCVDLAPGIEMFPGMSSAQPRWKEIFTKYADRIVFSTDHAPMSARIQKPIAPSYLYRFLLTEDHFTFYTGKQIQGLGLEKDIVRKILAGNFLRQTGGAPKPICRDALKAYLQKYEPLITHAENKACIFAQCETEGLL